MGGILLVVTGPTAVGKTRLCLDIARRYNIPIINADSRQIYCGMTIGTAAPTTEQMAEVKHYFVGTLNIGDYFNASMYEQAALKVIVERLCGCGEPMALLTGGSMMYIDAVCDGIDDIPTIRDDIRMEMKRRLDTEGLEALCEELRQLDPEHYEVVDRQNPRRVVHALEICHQTGRTYTSFRRHAKRQRPFHTVKIVLNRPREELYARINARVDQMVADGLLNEAQRLYSQREQNALNTVGYKEMFDYIDGRFSFEEAVERIKGNTRRYARKQLTWFKKYENAAWFNPEDKQKIMDFIDTNYEQQTEQR